MRKAILQFRKSRGSVLIAVLGLIALLSAMLISFLAEATERIKFNGLLDNRTDLRERAYSGLEVSLAAIAQIAEIDKGLKSTAQGWEDPLKYAGFTPFDDCDLKVTVEDESAKLPLAILTEKQLAEVFEEMDVSSSEADHLAILVMDWMDADDNARLDSMDGDDYENADFPCKPTNAVPRTWDDFLKIKDLRKLFLDENGHPNEKFESFTSSVSLYSTYNVNVNDTSPFILEILGKLGGFDDQKVLRTLEGSDGIRGTSDDVVATGVSELGVPDIPLSDFSTQLLHVRVVASRGGSHFTIDALLKYSGVAKATQSATLKPKLSNGYEDFPKDPKGTLAYPFTIVQLTEIRKAP
jgi:general secretion pathway protein K